MSIVEVLTELHKRAKHTEQEFTATASAMFAEAARDDSVQEFVDASRTAARAAGARLIVIQIQEALVKARLDAIGAES